MSKGKKIYEYIKTYPNLYDWLYFNVVLNMPGNMSILTDSDAVLEDYIDGSCRKEYIFSIAMVKNYDTGTSDINMQALQEAENFTEWFEENNRKQLFPDLGENCMVEEMEVVNGVPQLALDVESNIARYMIACKIKYMERK